MSVFNDRGKIISKIDDFYQSVLELSWFRYVHLKIATRCTLLSAMNATKHWCVQISSSLLNESIETLIATEGGCQMKSSYKHFVHVYHWCSFKMVIPTFQGESCMKWISVIMILFLNIIFTCLKSATSREDLMILDIEMTGTNRLFADMSLYHFFDVYFTH